MLFAPTWIESQADTQLPYFPLSSTLFVYARPTVPLRCAIRSMLAECPGNLTAVLQYIDTDSLTEKELDACGDFVDSQVLEGKCPKKLCDCVMPAAALVAQNQGGECIKAFDSVMDDVSCAKDVDTCLTPAKKKYVEWQASSAADKSCFRDCKRAGACRVGVPRGAAQALRAAVGRLEGHGSARSCFLALRLPPAAWVLIKLT